MMTFFECADDLTSEISMDVLVMPHITTFGSGFDFLSFCVSAFTIRMGGKAEERFKGKIKDITRRSNNLEAKVMIHIPLLEQSLGDRPVRERCTLGNMGNQPHCDNGKGVPSGTP